MTHCHISSFLLDQILSNINACGAYRPGLQVGYSWATPAFHQPSLGPSLKRHGREYSDDSLGPFDVICDLKLSGGASPTVFSLHLIFLTIVYMRKVNILIVALALFSSTLVGCKTVVVHNHGHKHDHKPGPPPPGQAKPKPTPPGQAKKATGSKSAKPHAPGQQNKSK